MSQELVDDALADESARLVRAHLEACAACGRAFRGLAAVARALSGLPVYSLGPEARARILTVWAAYRRNKAGWTWASAAILAFACCGLALALWVFYASLNASNGQAVLNLLLDPDRAQVMLQLTLMRWSMSAGHWWSAAETWMRPAALLIKGWVILTLLLFAAMVSMFLVIGLHSRLQSASRLGEYL